MPLALLRTRSRLHTCIIAFLFTVLCCSFFFFSVLCVNLLKVKYYTYQLGIVPNWRSVKNFMPWKYAVQRKCSMLFKYSRQNRKMNVTRGRVLKNSISLNFLPCRYLHFFKKLRKYWSIITLKKSFCKWLKMRRFIFKNVLAFTRKCFL